MKNLLRNNTLYITIIKIIINLLIFRAGTLVIVFNYTGDRFNFGMAVEKAKVLGLKVTNSTRVLCPKHS